MHTIHSRWHKPKGRATNRKQRLSEIAKKRWADKSSVCEGEKNVTESDPSEILPSTSYTIIDDSILCSLLKNVPCDNCLQNTLVISKNTALGFSTKLELSCAACKKSFGSTFTSSRDISSKTFDVNNKLVKAFLSIGKGQAAMDSFSMVLGASSMDRKTFSKCLNNLHIKNNEFKTEMLRMSRDAVRKAYLEMDSDVSPLDITVSYDGTWQKRGHTSLYGIGVCIDSLTGLVVDYEILSKYCADCTIAERDLGKDSAEYFVWKEGHSTECQKNFSGSSGSMEVKAAEILWLRSISSCNMRYVSMISDGDSKAYQNLIEKKVYGPGIIVKKEECINHVSKRLGTALRKKVSEWKTKGLTLGGRKDGSLKEETIKKLQNFYRNAIVTNTPDLKAMKRAVLATLFHCKSTDKKPLHHNCPVGSDSWCFFQRALALKTKPQPHRTMKTKLSEEVIEKILPIYQRLTSDELLSRCISGKTQNANEALHSCIWKKCSKDVFVSKKRLALAVCSAVSEFNLGCVASLQLEKEVPNNSLEIAEKKDNRRQSQKHKKSSSDFKESQKKKFKKSNKACGKDYYSPGAF